MFIASTSEVFGRYAYHVTEFDSTTLGVLVQANNVYDQQVIDHIEALLG